MIFGKTDWFSIITGCFLLLMVAAPASASPFPVVIRGTILEMNETDQTLLLQADCEHAWCQVNVTGMYTGRIPGTAVLSTLNTGEMVEAVFNAWYMDLHDPSTGYVESNRMISGISGDGGPSRNWPMGTTRQNLRERTSLVILYTSQLLWRAGIPLRMISAVLHHRNMTSGLHPREPS